jgi:hypothetical protein
MKQQETLREYVFSPVSALSIQKEGNPMVYVFKFENKGNLINCSIVTKTAGVQYIASWLTDLDPDCKKLITLFKSDDISIDSPFFNVLKHLLKNLDNIESDKRLKVKKELSVFDISNLKEGSLSKGIEDITIDDVKDTDLKERGMLVFAQGTKMKVLKNDLT